MGLPAKVPSCRTTTACAEHGANGMGFSQALHRFKMNSFAIKVSEGGTSFFQHWARSTISCQ